MSVNDNRWKRLESLLRMYYDPFSHKLTRCCCNNDSVPDNALMLTDKVQVLSDLKDRGLLVAAPPRDDDDAYAITIARDRKSTRLNSSHVD